MLRLIAAAGLFRCGIESALSAADLLAALPAVLAAIAGLFLVAGLFTPFAAVAAAAIEAWFAFSHPEFNWPQMALAGLSLSLAMIGPGAWSIDARLFGRKQIDLKL